MKFLAGLQNGHTAFNDRWLWRTAGRSAGFAIKKLQDTWVVTSTAVPDLFPGDYPAAIDGEAISVWAERIAPYVSASTEWSRSEAIFSRFLAPFKHNGRAIIIGRTTAGTSGQPFVKDFGNDMVLIVGSKREMFPDGSQFEGVGIAPDVHVELAPDDIRDDIDQDCQHALKSLDGRSR